jgi:hypothetical protein
MGECKLDHSLEDVRKKFEEQASFLPDDIKLTIDRILREDLSQEALNEIFHLLKKYDLAGTEERENRNIKMRNLNN